MNHIIEKLAGVVVICIPMLAAIHTGNLHYLWAETIFLVFAVEIQSNDTSGNSPQ